MANAQPDTKGRSLLSGLMKTLERQDFDHQVQKVADHFGVSKKEVLVEILGRKERKRTK